MLLCCPELTNHLHSDILLGITFILIPNGMGFCHGQILIETETDSYMSEFLLSICNDLFWESGISIRMALTQF